MFTLAFVVLHGLCAALPNIFLFFFFPFSFFSPLAQQQAGLQSASLETHALTYKDTHTHVTFQNDTVTARWPEGKSSAQCRKFARGIK